MSAVDPQIDPAFDRRDRYEALMEVVRGRMTNRAFAPCEIPREHYALILEAARHGPSGANCQPWHFIVVDDSRIKDTIGRLFIDEQQVRAKLKMGFPTPNYHGMRTAPGFIAIVTDFRLVSAFPVLSDESALAEAYRANAERILIQSVAAATMSAHLAAAALGYAVWWVTAIGQQAIQEAIRPLLGIPPELSPIDIMCFGPPAKPSYKRWKKRLDEIVNWGQFDPSHLMSDEDIENWIKTQRHKVMYRDESKID